MMRETHTRIVPCWLPIMRCIVIITTKDTCVPRPVGTWPPANLHILCSGVRTYCFPRLVRTTCVRAEYATIFITVHAVGTSYIRRRTPRVVTMQYPFYTNL